MEELQGIEDAQLALPWADRQNDGSVAAEGQAERPVAGRPRT